MSGVATRARVRGDNFPDAGPTISGKRLDMDCLANAEWETA